MNLNKKAQGSIYLVLTLLIWALFAVFSRMIESQQLNSWDLTFLRFSFASVIIIIYLLITKKWVNFKILPLLLLSIFGGVGYCAIVYTAFLFAPVSHSAIWLNTCIPLSAFILTWLFIKDGISVKDFKVFITIFIAIIFMLIYGFVTGTYQFSIGDLLFFVGSIFWATYTLLLKKYTVSISQALVGVTFISFIIYFPIYLFFLPKNILNESWEIIAIQGVFHGFFMVIIASITFIKSIEILGAFNASSVLALAPFLAVILAIPILGEWPDIASLIGLSGLLIAIMKPWDWKYFRRLSNHD